jgi:hypothetical protein
MEMEYRLSCAGADIEHCAVAILNVALAGNLSRRQVAVADEFGVPSLRLFEPGKMSFGDH